MHARHGKLSVILVGIMVTLLGAGASSAMSAIEVGASRALDPAMCAPDENAFTSAIDNDFFPLPVGKRWSYSGREEGRMMGLRISVLDRTERFYGRRVVTRVVQELEWVDTDADSVVDRNETLVEVSSNYFAQTRTGTVCYFGEDVEIYEKGKVVSTKGSWRADARGNAPGIFMPVEQQIDAGVAFRQEMAPRVAEDRALILDDDVTVKVPARTYRDAIKVRDINLLDGSSGVKFYARGVGLIVDGSLRLVRLRS